MPRSACALLLAILSFFPLSSRAVEADDAPLRVMSFNIRYGTAKDGENHWDNRRDFVIETIKAFNPDLLGTQETLQFQADYLVEHLDGYTSVAVGRDDGLSKGETVALLYRSKRFQLMDSGNFWLSETPEVPGSKNWDAAITRMVTWVKLRDRQAQDQPPLYFFNTHFDHIGRDARARSAKLLHERIAALDGNPPVIATGDFNEGEASPPYQALFTVSADGSSLLHDAYRLAHPERQVEEGTFNGFNAAAREGTRIDWIACTKHFDVKSAEIDRTSREGKVPSDHYPITAILAYPQ